jgi:hypothetical protein
MWISHNKELGAVYPKFKELKSVDVVDEGAATDSMFSNGENALLELSRIIYDPQFPAVLEANYKDWAPLNQFFKEKYSSSFFDQLMKKLGISEDREEITSLTNQNQAMSNEIETLTAERDQLTQERDQLTEERDQALSQLSTLTETINSLSARIDALEATPLASHTSGNEDEDSQDDTPSYMMDPVTRRAYSLKSKSK